MRLHIPRRGRATSDEATNGASVRGRGAVSVLLDTTVLIDALSGGARHNTRPGGLPDRRCSGDACDAAGDGKPQGLPDG